MGAVLDDERAQAGGTRCNMLWIGRSLGPVERACMLSVLAQGHPLDLYCYEAPEGVPDGVALRDAREVLPESAILPHRSGSVALFSNRFRYELQRLGRGVWLDCDVYLLRPIESDRPYLFGLTEPGQINGAVLRIPAGSPLLGELLRPFQEREVPAWLPMRERIAARLRRARTGRTGLADMPWGTAGPHALTARARAAGLDRWAVLPEVFYPVHWRQADWIGDPQIRIEQVTTPRTVAVHLWNECIKRFKDAPAPAGSFLARLQAEGAGAGVTPRPAASPRPAPLRRPAEPAAPPRVSVTMPVHNALPFLDESVRSILDQSFADFELIVRDDGSTDGSRAALRDWARSDCRIHLFEGEEQLGPVGSSNWVVGKARAPLIARMDADDVAFPDRLRRQVEILDRRPDVVLVGALSKGIGRSGERIRPPEPWRLAVATRMAPFAHSTAMYRRAAFERVGGYRPGCEYWEDLDLYLRLTSAGRAAVIAEPLLAYRHAPTSTRLVSRRDQVERALDGMYRAIASGGADGISAAPPARGGKLTAQTLIASGSTRLWTGQRPAMFGRMVREAELGFDPLSAAALAWALWGSVSPASLRQALRLVANLRNRAVRGRIRNGEVYEWRPGRPTRPLTDTSRARNPAPDRLPGRPAASVSDA